MTEITKNQLYTVTITGYTAEGLGVARIYGRVVFVHGAVRGEVCKVHILKVLKNAAFARVAEVLECSPARRDPDCPHYPACGGCNFRHICYEEELEAKRQRVEDALRRIGGVDIHVEEILGCDCLNGYRNKSQFPVSAEGRLGFYRARSHEVIPVVDCLLQTPQANAAARALEEYLREYNVPAYNESLHQGLLRHLYVRTNRDGAALICLVANGEELPYEQELVERLRAAVPELTGVVLSCNTARTNVVLGSRQRTLWGQDYWEDVLCGRTFRLSVPSFYQVNRIQTERLYEKAVAFACLTGQDTVLDLYCGAGTITLAMAPYAREVIGAEIVPEAVSNARENARRNGIKNVRFLLGDAGEIAGALVAEALRPQVIVVDPPRKGLGGEVIAAVRKMTPERVVYISCDPGTLARDVKLFAETGYCLTRAAAVDMFPRTRHVETIVLLQRGNS